LTGHFDANHARLARSMLRRLDLVEQALAELDAVIVDACEPWRHQIELLQTIPGVGEKVALRSFRGVRASRWVGVVSFPVR